MELARLHDQAGRLKAGLRRVFFGQDDVLDQLLATVYAGGHVLLEGVPGLGKTLLAKGLARLFDADTGTMTAGQTVLIRGDRIADDGRDVQVPPGARVLDLYCGSGLFTIALARQCTRVVGIEENLQAIKDAEANARINRIEEGRLRFLRARVDDRRPSQCQVHSREL